MDRLFRLWCNCGPPESEQVESQVKDKTCEFAKLAQEVKLYASPVVSERIDDLAACWQEWLAATPNKHACEELRLESTKRYQVMFAAMQREVGPDEVRLALGDDGDLACPWSADFDLQERSAEQKQAEPIQASAKRIAPVKPAA